MTRQTGIRSRDSILAELARGPITDPSGRATAKLLELTGYQGTLTASTSAG